RRLFSSEAPRVYGRQVTRLSRRNRRLPSMQRGERQRSNGIMEKWSNGIFNTPALQHSNTPMAPARRTQLRARPRSAFALYEVLLGVAIFAVGVIALGRAVENCLNASTKIGRASCRERVWV